MDFDVPFFSTLNHQALPGGDRSLRDLQTGPGFALKKLEDREEIKRFYDLVRTRPEWIESPLRQILLAYHTAGRDHAQRIAQPAYSDTTLDLVVYGPDGRAIAQVKRSTAELAESKTLGNLPARKLARHPPKQASKNPKTPP